MKQSPLDQRARGRLSSPLKRGHNRDFALTRNDIDAVIRSTKSQTSKAILILASSGYTVKEIVNYKADGGDVDSRLTSLRWEYTNCLMQFPLGFGISEVAVWRRTKKALTKAAERNLIDVDLDRIPFPEALRHVKEEGYHIREKIVALAQRIHILNGGAFDLRDPLTACPHIDCSTVRELLDAVDRERRQRT